MTTRRIKLFLLFFAMGFFVYLHSFVLADNLSDGTIPSGTPSVYLPLVANSAPTPTPTATPLSQGVEVKSSRGFTKPNSKFFYIDGEVINKTSANAYRVKVKANFFDAAHKIIDSDITDVFLGVVFPQGVGPFEFFSSKEGITSYEMTVSYLDHDTTDFRALTILSRQVRNNSGIEVFGEIRNDSGSTLHAGALSATFYDASGNVIEAHYGFVDVHLDKGQTTAYSVSTNDSFSYASYVVQAQGYVIP